ncbi:hypothetical protein P9112_012840 [Eukaryota sp. TZLM1-RC]
MHTSSVKASALPEDPSFSEGSAPKEDNTPLENYRSYGRKHPSPGDCSCGRRKLSLGIPLLRKQEILRWSSMKARTLRIPPSSSQLKNLKVYLLLSLKDVLKYNLHLLLKAEKRFNLLKLSRKELHFNLPPLKKTLKFFLQLFILNLKFHPLNNHLQFQL